MKIGFYFGDRDFSSIDLSNPDLGNPGIGGSEYMFSLISFYLAKKTNHKIFIYVKNADKLPNITTNKKVDNLVEVLIQSEIDNLDYLILRIPKEKHFGKLFSKQKTKIIVWAHNFAKLNELNQISKCKQVVKYVCVSKQQLEQLNGHPIYKKSTYIYNAIVTKIYNSNVKNDNKSICYLGSIVKTKGFDICARIWRELYNNDNNIELNIIGSGQLYNKNKKLGKYNIAKKEYEDEFIQYLIDNNGNILPKVHFYGVLGHKEKINVIASSFVGMPNPSGLTETFGISAIEFEIMGKPVITKDSCGFKNTVINNKTGFLCNKEKEFIEKYNHLVNNNKKYKEMSTKAINYAKNFDVEIIINDWIALFFDLNNNQDSLKRNTTNTSFKNKIHNLISLCFS